MRAVFLFTNERSGLAKRVANGEDSDNAFQGALRLSRYGIESDFIELENTFPKKVAYFLRHKVLSMHFLHVVLLPRMRKYDFVVTSTGFGTLLVRAIFHLPPRKWILFDYSLSGQLGQKKTFKQRVLGWVIGKADGFITLSKEEADTMKRLYPNKSNAITFLPFACDLNYFKKNENVSEENFILSVGRDPGRDWKTFFNAVSGLGVSCKITARHTHLASLATIPKEVSCHDFNAQELLAEYSKAKIVVLPLGPTFPNDSMGCSTLVEAMSMSKAIIATDTVTMRNYITHNVNGILVPQGDSVAMQRAIKELLEDDKKRFDLGVQARKFVQENCDPEIYSKKLAEYLRSVY